MTYKDRFFRNYQRTHLEPRKGKISTGSLKETALRLEKSFRRFLPKDKAAVIIDAGCGYGAAVWWLHQLGYSNAEGIDVSPELIETARTLGIAKVNEANLVTFLAQHADTYDLIFARDVLEHFSKDEIVENLDLMYGALKQGGTLVIQAPNGESPFGGRIRYGDFTHETAFTSSSLSQLLLMSGFVTVRTYPVQPPVVGLKSLVRFLMWKVAEACWRVVLTAETGRGTYVVTQNLIAVARK